VGGDAQAAKRENEGPTRQNQEGGRGRNPVLEEFAREKVVTENLMKNLVWYEKRECFMDPGPGEKKQTRGERKKVNKGEKKTMAFIGVKKKRAREKTISRVRKGRKKTGKENFWDADSKGKKKPSGKRKRGRQSRRKGKKNRQDGKRGKLSFWGKRSRYQKEVAFIWKNPGGGEA